LLAGFNRQPIAVSFCALAPPVVGGRAGPGLAAGHMATQFRRGFPCGSGDDADSVVFCRALSWSWVGESSLMDYSCRVTHGENGSVGTNGPFYRKVVPLSMSIASWAMGERGEHLIDGYALLAVLNPVVHTGFLPFRARQMCR